MIHPLIVGIVVRILGVALPLSSGAWFYSLPSLFAIPLIPFITVV